MRSQYGNSSPSQPRPYSFVYLNTLVRYLHLGGFSRLLKNVAFNTQIIFKIHKILIPNILRSLVFSMKAKDTWGSYPSPGHHCFSFLLAFVGRKKKKEQYESCQFYLGAK